MRKQERSPEAGDDLLATRRRHAASILEAVGSQLMKEERVINCRVFMPALLAAGVDGASGYYDYNPSHADTPRSHASGDSLTLNIGADILNSTEDLLCVRASILDPERVKAHPRAESFDFRRTELEGLALAHMFGTAMIWIPDYDELCLSDQVSIEADRLRSISPLLAKPALT